MENKNTNSQSFKFFLNIEKLQRMQQTLNTYHNNFQTLLTPFSEESDKWSITCAPNQTFNERDETLPNNKDLLPIRLKKEATNTQIYNQIKQTLNNYHSEVCEKTKCIICYGSLFKKKDPDLPKVKIPCQHFFHQHCLETWIYEKWNQFESKEIQYSCPLCKNAFF